jgi:endonuclease/exonuclease/phosphatase family metal-dependent hydrolase
MNLITLNTWGGRGGYQELMQFFRDRANTDIFCLQEIWAGGNEEMIGVVAGGQPLVGIATTLLEDISAALPDHHVIFHPHFRDYYGLATFIKKSYSLVAEGEVFVYHEKDYESPDEPGNHARNLQYVTLETTTGPLTVINFHGLWNGMGKTDTPDRIMQSVNIFEFTKTLSTPFIVAGDFNLRPDTESLALLERAGMHNLVTKFGITSTRTSLYQKDERYADYVLTSEAIIVDDFCVLPEEVSDHAALKLTFRR